MNANQFQTRRLVQETDATALLTDREKHLIGLAVTLTRGCQDCSAGRLEKAVAAGIDMETLRAAIDLTAAVNAGVALRTALESARRAGIEE